MENPFMLFIREGFLLLLLVSGVPLLAGSVSGLCVAALQSVTQVQEQGVTFLTKFLTVTFVLWLFGDRIAEQLILYVRSMLASIAYLG